MRLGFEWHGAKVANSPEHDRQGHKMGWKWALKWRRGGVLDVKVESLGGEE